jgi:hypothetical protein
VDNTLRNPRYLLPLAALIAVTVISLVLAQATSTDAGSSPQTTAQPAATVVPASPTRAAPSAADARRAADLAKIGDLLATYKSRNGTYPTTEQYFSTLCQLAFDAGCLLTTISKELPVTDGATPYWYRSDGQSYSLFAVADAKPDPDNCPDEVPPTLAGKPLICLSSAGGGR